MKKSGDTQTDDDVDDDDDDDDTHPSRIIVPVEIYSVRDKKVWHITAENGFLSSILLISFKICQNSGKSV